MFPFDNELHKSYPVHSDVSLGTNVLWLEKITLSPYIWKWIFWIVIFWRATMKLTKWVTEMEKKF